MKRRRRGGLGRGCFHRSRRWIRRRHRRRWKEIPDLRNSRRVSVASVPVRTRKNVRPSDAGHRKVTVAGAPVSGPEIIGTQVVPRSGLSSRTTWRKPAGMRPSRIAVREISSVETREREGSNVGSWAWAQVSAPRVIAPQTRFVFMTRQVSGVRGCQVRLSRRGHSIGRGRSLE